MDYKYTYYSKYNESTYSYDTESITTLGVKASTDLGIGLMVGENSIGYVAGLSVDTRNALSYDPIKDLKIEHKAGTLNGEYYDPVQLLDAVIVSNKTVIIIIVICIAVRALCFLFCGIWNEITCS